MKPITKMRSEIQEIPTAVDRLMTRSGPEIERVAEIVRARNPQFAVTSPEDRRIMPVPF